MHAEATSWSEHSSPLQPVFLQAPGVGAGAQALKVHTTEPLAWHAQVLHPSVDGNDAPDPYVLPPYEQVPPPGAGAHARKVQTMPCAVHEQSLHPSVDLNVSPTLNGPFGAGVDVVVPVATSYDTVSSHEHV